MGLTLGSLAPDFILMDAGGESFRLSDHLFKRPVVLFFYPRDFTPGCTAEACSFRDAYEDFIALGALVVGISSDSREAHGKFVAKYNLPYPVLSDPQQKVRTLYQVRNRFFNLLPGRETFVIDRQGKLAMAYDNPGAGKHMQRALEMVKTL